MMSGICRCVQERAGLALGWYGRLVLPSEGEVVVDADGDRWAGVREHLREVEEWYDVLMEDLNGLESVEID